MTGAQLHRRSVGSGPVCLLLAAFFGASAAVGSLAAAHDPVTMALGGAGVAQPAGAGQSRNPAGLALRAADAEGSRQHLYLGARLHDPQDLIDRVEAFQDAEVVARTRASSLRLQDALDEADDFRTALIDAVVGGGPEEPIAVPGDLREALGELVARTEELRGGLELLDGRAAIGEGGGALAVERPDPGFGYAVSISHGTWLRAETRFRDAFLEDALDDLDGLYGLLNRDELDEEAVDRLTDWLDQALERDPPVIELDLADRTLRPGLDTEDLDSTVRIRGVSITDVGFSLARLFDLGDQGVAVGVTPKVQQVVTYDYRKPAHEAERWAFYGSRYRDSSVVFNADVGAAYPMGAHWQLGLKVRNVIPHDLTTAAGGQVRLRPQARVGGAYDGGGVRLAVDADLNEADPLDDGYGARFAGLGAEWPVTERFDLRLGYRHDLAQGDRHVGSIGFGYLFRPRLAIDLALAGSRDEIGGALRLAW